MTTTMILLGAPALLALLGYLAASGRIADSRDGRDWQSGHGPRYMPSDTPDTAEPRVSARGGGKGALARRAFGSRQVEFVAVTRDRDEHGTLV
ncbi:hypothetical protein [Streptodolium elevatio]|uniref:Uncharacterized protein n=1 Tax=Streptodolium elevatio TaxID=3157996 RepID=A0ABV3DB84_9ACTN